MSDVVIRVENLGKCYRIAHQANGQHRERYTALRDVITQTATAPLKRLRSAFSGNSQQSSLNTQPSASAPSSEDFWALRNVSFDIKRGEVVGIIGRNGAGKSTLLKILSRITEPTTGRIGIKGRVASLLEVGTGFHPELTGRENIYLNGAILGMSRTEIGRKFNEIIAFAEIEKFLDTPVKRYSSGMYVRLAFSVAAHLEPEILIVDEVLAVGDADFQKKCLGKMREVASSQGRTVIFVSHIMSAIRQLCSSAILLTRGEIVAKGETSAMAARYFQSLKSEPIVEQSSSSSAYLVTATITDAKGVEAFHLEADSEYKLYLTITNRSAVNLTFGMTLFNDEDMATFSSLTSDSLPEFGLGTFSVMLRLPIKWLNPGGYRIQGALSCRDGIISQNDNCIRFHVSRSNKFDIAGGRSVGVARIATPWEIFTQ